MAEVVAAQLRSHLLHLASGAYTRLLASRLAKLLALSEDAAVHAAQQEGWQLEQRAEQDFLIPPPPQPTIEG